jgi:hypothetical protein
VDDVGQLFVAPMTVGQLFVAPMTVGQLFVAPMTVGQLFVAPMTVVACVGLELTFRQAACLGEYFKLRSA